LLDQQRALSDAKWLNGPEDGIKSWMSQPPFIDQRYSASEFFMGDNLEWALIGFNAQ
jgi:hypothetical protein